MGEKLDRNQLILLSVTGLLIFFGLWTFAAWVELAPRKFLPLPWEVVERGIALLSKPFSGQTLQGHLAASLERYLLGFALAAAIGVPLGVIAGSYLRLNAFLKPLSLFGRNVPIAALIPLTLIWFGIDEVQKVMFIFLATVSFVLFDSTNAVQAVPDRFLDTGYTLGVHHTTKKGAIMSGWMALIYGFVALTG
jgi:NitT/TauT family transport system permease protein